MKINKKGLKVGDFVKVSRSHGSQVSRKKVNGFGIVPLIQFISNLALMYHINPIFLPASLYVDETAVKARLGLYLHKAIYAPLVIKSLRG